MVIVQSADSAPVGLVTAVDSVQVSWSRGSLVIPDCRWIEVFPAVPVEPAVLSVPLGAPVTVYESSPTFLAPE